MQHNIERTSPKGPGKPFIGRCILCGKTGLTMGDALKKCDNPRRVTAEQALIMLIEGKK